MPIMNKVHIISTCIIILTFFMPACSNQTTPNQKKDTRKEEMSSMAAPPVIIYKTKMDFGKNVPVTLSEDKSRVSSYPDKNDLKYKGNFAYPTTLRDGYLLDNRGINEHVAFLDYTYEEFSKLEKTPSATDLMGHIIEYDPLLEMVQCGNRHDYKNLVDELNEKIAGEGFEGCNKLK